MSGVQRMEYLCGRAGSAEAKRRAGGKKEDGRTEKSGFSGAYRIKESGAYFHRDGGA